MAEATNQPTHNDRRSQTSTAATTPAPGEEEHGQTPGPDKPGRPTFAMYKKSVLGGFEFDVTDFDGRSYRRSLLLRNGEKAGALPMQAIRPMYDLVNQLMKENHELRKQLDKR